MTDHPEPPLLLRRLRDAGFDADSVRPAGGGVVAQAGIATLRDGGRVFAKTLPGDVQDLFAVEASGLAALRGAGLNTPDVLSASSGLLVLAAFPAFPDTDQAWESLGRAVAALHGSTVQDRFGWHRDGWLGRMRQVNTWTSDGHAFFAAHRILRWLPAIDGKLDAGDRRAVERLCARLPDLVPDLPACLTHGDLWPGNILGTPEGGVAVVDPAVSYTWAEVDLSMMWCSPRPPRSDRFFAAYAEAGTLADGWQERMRVLHLREVLSTIAHGDDDWDAVGYVREVVAPFRVTRRTRPPQSAPGIPRQEAHGIARRP
ncbi:fructosamine kinase family protein [Streptomyces sp. NPDC020917]|uniref:fructosamine kinase family protein n=1 Tax=Streptomyces sp. NPDC020917 TaxID=3365102 RepID=UPI0037888F16